jgi:hypothetical protein
MATALRDGSIVALRLLVALATSTIGGTDGASVSLRRRGRLATLAATDQTVVAMDAHQYATGEGPCIDASVDGTTFYAESLSAETRWPMFVPRARSLGINAIFSSALMAGDEPAGSLNLYSLHESAFTPYDQEVASIFAAETSRKLGGVRMDGSDEDLAASRDGPAREPGSTSSDRDMCREGSARGGDDPCLAGGDGLLSSANESRRKGAPFGTSGRSLRSDPASSTGGLRA